MNKNAKLFITCLGLGMASYINVAAAASDAILFKIHDVVPVKNADGNVVSCDVGATFYNRTEKEINNASLNLIWADVKSSLFSNVLYLEQLNVIDGKDMEADDLTLRVRGIGLNPQGTVRVERLAGGRCRVWLSEAAWAVAPGQPVAFYWGDWLVGGGIVCRVEKVEKIDAPCCGIQ